MEGGSDNKTFFAIIIAGFFIGLGIFFSGFSKTPEIKIEPNQIQESQTAQVFNSECWNISDAQSHVGENGCVVGKIEKVFISKSGTIFFDYCSDYKTCPFTAVIFKSDSSKFDNIYEYQGKTIELKGLIKSYKGKPEIIINDSSQIKIID